jgi:hypothetical protein
MALHSLQDILVGRGATGGLASVDGWEIREIEKEDQD